VRSVDYKVCSVLSREAPANLYKNRVYPISVFVENMPDSENNAYDDQSHSGRRLRPRGKQRKPFIIEYRLERRTSNGTAHILGLYNWITHSRYTTRSRRDEAYAVLVKKTLSGPPYWKPEYRKRDR
jgi:hypothetical protein